MTTALGIITAAYRETNITAAGQVPTSAQQTEALQRLVNLISSAYGFEVGNQLIDWPVGNSDPASCIPSWTDDDWKYLEANIRIVAVNDSAQTLLLPQNPRDGARIGIVDPQSRLAAHPITLSSETRSIEGATSVVLNTNGLTRLWFYRADLGAWLVLSELTDVDDDMPFPSEFDDYFITALAMRLNPRYGRSLAAESISRLERTLDKLRARYRDRTPVPVDEGLLATTRGYGSWRGRNTSRLVRGRSRWMV